MLRGILEYNYMASEEDTTALCSASIMVSGLVCRVVVMTKSSCFAERKLPLQQNSVQIHCGSMRWSPHVRHLKS